MEGDITGISGSFPNYTISVQIDVSNGSGTFSSWTFNLAGIRSFVTGPTGAGYQVPNSSTTVVISVGSKTFTTTYTGAYSNGSRIRVSESSNSANWVEGNVTAVTTTTITFLVDRISGTGTITTPVISIVGQPAPINIYTNGNVSTSANRILYSTSTPGVTTGTAGDIWIQY